jgi:hypothetical protein
VLNKGREYKLNSKVQLKTVVGTEADRILSAEGCVNVGPMA